MSTLSNLFRIEQAVPDTGPPDDLPRLALVAEVRNERSRWVVKAIECWVIDLAGKALPESALGKAVAYVTKLWPGLVRFLDDPSVPLSNNVTERAIRGVVVGRKNHYGSKSRRGTEVAALFYTIFETAKLCGVEPKGFLKTAVRAALAGEAVLLPHMVAGTTTTAPPASESIPAETASTSSVNP